jgi:hypothetical protein
MKIRPFIYCLLFLVLVSNCKKKGTTTYYIDNSFKEWVLFQKGSYWVYLNEKRQVQDSTYIIMQPRYGFTPPPSENLDHYEQIYYDVSNSFLKSVAINREPGDSYVSLEFFYPDDGAGFTGLNSSITDGTWSGSSNSFKLIEKIDTIFLNSSRFTNVIHTRSTSTYYDNLQNDYYFAKNIGLVKFAIKTNTFDSTWSLMRWHVIQ